MGFEWVSRFEAKGRSKRREKTNLVDLAPSVLDSRHVEQDGAVLPKGALFDVVDEAYGRKVHVQLALRLDGGRIEDVGRFRGAEHGALLRQGLVLGNGPSELCRAEDVRDESVVVQTPDAVRAGRLEGVCEDEFPDHFEVSTPQSARCIGHKPAQQWRATNARLDDS